MINIVECREHADLYKRLSGASGISKDRADVLENIARTGLAGQLDRWLPFRGTSKGRACTINPISRRGGRARVRLVFKTGHRQFALASPLRADSVEKVFLG